jgi:hypothetical protein
VLPATADRAGERRVNEAEAVVVRRNFEEYARAGDPG